MNIEDEITKNRGRLKKIEFKLQALINILSKEGIIVRKDIDNEIDEFLDDKEEKDEENKK